VGEGRGRESWAIEDPCKRSELPNGKVGEGINQKLRAEIAFKVKSWGKDLNGAPHRGNKRGGGRKVPGYTCQN